MFFEPKTLIVVYKDEMMLNQFRKLVETNDDTSEGNVVGVTDGSVRIVAWTEKVWKDQKKAGNINNKVLFLGNVAESDKLIPIIDIQYDKYGITYGWAGNQALINVSPKKLANKENYNDFLKELSMYSLPEQIRPENTMESTEKIADTNALAKTKEGKKAGFASFIGKAIKITGEAVESVTSDVKKAVLEVDSAIDDLPADRYLMTKQQLFYGIMKLYENSLEKFMKS